MRALEGKRRIRNDVPWLWKARSIGTRLSPIVTENFPTIQAVNVRSVRMHGQTPIGGRVSK
ncbi:hypothetical protein LMG28690_04411 [Paraburkholderia caffeinilytica]|nr:hypothetical protein LMG28690_04411 [Paraburkholderia caffeinilytica]